jgi:O-6-methylguanine DNA methyltransferase
MTTTAPNDLAALAAELAALREPAPATLRPRVLAAIGLADEYASLETPIGLVFVAWNARGISAIVPATEPAAFEARFAAELGRKTRRVSILPPDLRRRVERRLAGDRRVDVPVDLRGGTDFERAVWRKALEIPHGEVRPYGWIAAEIGAPKAVRAVGSALGRNPVPLVIPCHRVVRTDGSLGQYALGVPAKRAALSAEGVDLGRLEDFARRGIRYLGSDTTHVFCLPTCRDARRVTERHLRSFHSADEATTAGYRPCRHCRPVSASAAA